jgi:hypothetical protein
MGKYELGAPVDNHVERGTIKLLICRFPQNNIIVVLIEELGE